MKILSLFSFILLLTLSTSTYANLDGAVEIYSSPERMTDKELAPLLDPLTQGAEVIAIGESVHGSSGFLKVQERIIRYLVEKHGLRLVIWESPVIRSLELSAWVDSCRVAKSFPPIDVLYQPIDTDLPFFEWVCDFNFKNANNPIVWRGMDIWDRGWEHFDRIQNSQKSIGINPSLITSVFADCPLASLRNWTDINKVLVQVRSDKKFLPEDAFARCMNHLQMTQTEAKLIASLEKSKTPRFIDALDTALSASTLEGWLNYYNMRSQVLKAGWDSRDGAQGRNTELIMSQTGHTRAIVAAHTSHTSHNRSSADWWGWGDIKSGIHFFQKNTGKKVSNLALIGYDVTGIQGNWLRPTAPNSLEKKLFDAGRRLTFVPSSAPFLAEHTKWWFQNENTAGAYANGVETVLADHFDAYIYLDESHVGRALPSRPVWQP